ncbi:MAG: hypothetical protein LBK61_13780 [Spirochaetaceae bacterium]|jgi:hypothetical protein|nr:hypothetical protein [Spirochaetaceae bacterium]
MKKLLFWALVFAVAAGLSAQNVTVREVPEIEYARDAGAWSFTGPRLSQEDEGARLAKVNLGVQQEGEMLYEFNVRYEGGAEDGHGGVGIHILGDSRIDRASWGSGKSYLLWLNYDEHPISSDIPAGLSAQVYQSTTHSQMTLLHSMDLNDYLWYLDDEALSESIPFRILVNCDTGEVRVYDPTEDLDSVYFVFNIDKSDLPLKGDWVALRTNGVKASFALGL